MQYSEESILVRPNIGEINRYAQKAKHVAILSVNPVFSPAEDVKDLEALRIRVEGPASYLKYFNRLIEKANLKLT